MAEKYIFGMRLQIKNIDTLEIRPLFFNIKTMYTTGMSARGKNNIKKNIKTWYLVH